MSISINQLLKASQLTRHGRLLDATRLIQRVLGSVAGSSPHPASPGSGQAAPRAFNPSDAAAAAGPVEDVPFRDLPVAPANDMRFRASPDDSDAFPAASTDFEPAPVSPDYAAPDPVFDRPPAAERDAEPVTMPTPAPEPVQIKPRPASFRAYRFAFEGTDYAYRLYLPAALPVAGRVDAAAPTAADSAAPNPAPALLVLLHGCKQDAADFAKGTGMNALAAVQNCVVLYPEQLAKANSMRCWNWFEPAHQSREAGEPAMLAALTRQVIEQHGIDASRVYVAGLSAGGAMAAVLAAEYPDLFAAVGVHSGLPQGAAKDVMSAFSAMRSGPASSGAGLKSASKPAAGAGQSDTARPVPVIVFHGTADKTVNPDNGEHIVEAALQAFANNQLPLSEQRIDLPKTANAGAVGNGANGAVGGSGGSGRGAARSIFSAADGTSYVESWEIEAGPHAWSGGDAGGSFTDPVGPSASAAMLAFFLQHRRR